MTRPFTAGQMGPDAVELLNDLWELAEAAGLTSWQSNVVGAGTKATPTAADLFGIVDVADSNALKKITFAILFAMAGTLSNKRITARVTNEASSATPTINTDNCDIHQVTALATNVTSFTTNLTGTPVEGDVLIVEITGTATRTLSWGAKFEASTVALPTTTSSTNKLTVGFLYNAVAAKWRCMASC